jgi:hypothetical protein
MKSLILLLVLIPVSYLATCSVMSYRINSKFESIEVGNSHADVLKVMGVPSSIEKPNKLYKRFASSPCAGDCSLRLWYENRLDIDIEAWSFEFDSNDLVIEKTHWLSP